MHGEEGLSGGGGVERGRRTKGGEGASYHRRVRGWITERASVGSSLPTVTPTARCCGFAPLRRGGPTSLAAAASAAVRAQRGTRKRGERGEKKHKPTSAALLPKLGLWRDLQQRRSDAGRHGRVFAEGPEQTRGELRAFSGVNTRLRV